MRAYIRSARRALIENKRIFSLKEGNGESRTVMGNASTAITGIGKRGKGKRTLMREARIAAAQNGKIVDTLDSLDVMERAMGFFCRLAEAEESAAKPNIDKVREYWRDAMAMAREVAPYRHPRLSAVKIAKRDDDPLEGKTIEQLRAEILASLEELGVFENMPEGIAKPDAGIWRKASA